MRRVDNAALRADPVRRLPHSKTVWNALLQEEPDQMSVAPAVDFLAYDHVIRVVGMSYQGAIDLTVVSNGDLVQTGFSGPLHEFYRPHPPIVRPSGVQVQVNSEHYGWPDRGSLAAESRAAFE